MCTRPALLYGLCLLGLCFGPVYAAETIPEPLRRAAQAYLDKGADGFLPALLQGAVRLPAHAQTLTEQAQMLRRVEAHYGAYGGMEMIRTIQVATSTRLAFFVLNYQRGPLYGAVTLYRADALEVVTGFKVHTEIHRILPSGLIVRLP